MLWVLGLLTAVLLSLAAAPLGQWYLAWIALAPLFIAIGAAATTRRAMLVAWFAGVAYFGANLWWLWTASIAGMVTLVVYYALIWALAAALIRGIGLFRAGGDGVGDQKGTRWQLIVRVFGAAAVWVSCEWLRGSFPSGFPWIPIGTTQSPLLAMCQVADLGGPWIVSFWVVLPSALLAAWWLERPANPEIVRAVTAVAGVIVAVAAYGVWRLQTVPTPPTPSGPMVMVIQSNFRHLPGGAATADPPQLVQYFLSELEKNLAMHGPDLVVLPEAVLPPINDDARRALAQSHVGPFLEDTYQSLMAIAREHHTAVLVGGNAVTGWTMQGTEHVGTEIRNSAYFFDATADPPMVRYDKIRLVRFSERSPVSFGPAWLRRLGMLISAPRASQPLHAGTLSELQPFELRWASDINVPDERTKTRFIAPICLENVDPTVIAEMIRGTKPPYKQAEFVADISNDGWFATLEKYQHLQTTIFRCIENRVPMVRCSNSGISAFIDSSGRVEETIAPNTEGVAVRRIQLDKRRTFYTQFGDVFVYLCLMAVAVVLLRRVARNVRDRA